MYTNILKLSRALNHVDERPDFPIPQIVFYQTGVGSEPNLYSEYVQGATGYSLVVKVQEAYAFIAQNFHPGDEIYLFGFSRGAYTARMIAMIIGAIGVLNRTDMDNFADIFVSYQKLGKLKDGAEKTALQKKLDPWLSHDAPGKKRADSDQDTFSIKCVGVFDTVGSLGLPEELTHHAPSTKSLFGFSDTFLGEHIERAYQALALNETRADFNCAKFDQTTGGRKKGQVLKQCWFTGSHSDIGGGWHDHDLSDLTLTWMVANIEDMLSVDMTYIKSLPDPVALWGEQQPHDPRTGIFILSDKISRTLPTKTDDVTHETIHPSVLRQAHMLPQLQKNIDEDPALVCQLLPFEQEMREHWPYVPGKYDAKQSRGSAQVISVTSAKKDFLWSSTKEVVSVGAQLGQELFREVRQTTTTTSGGDNAQASHGSSWFAQIAHESHVGAIIKEFSGSQTTPKH
ncbi:hypothetical protein SERLA73DRAFT_96017 [Serpula lacrymans var. lacrymans S7.3]|uniref:T6SS Phospholipase effector Tle1-like catalytic domain-containing protein n=2 Tax=Serpula lacrymans var. lacrymans TaxID=341189 RepID=F8QA78_SERL3|nr:uncharacterized protein SERLADRAFT_363566 [Serpula lacrymans var. lacrymans S7.9]EGN94668.1 hypothetical protein SERLA73DRAFT_96017 [Serpula lacrymans var. lacrymans S7.3]EGO20151.1 hypothetical protein SERLADRAFT_363566 [Serpula lacrymans var. lacrymans S7.9]